MAGMSRKEISRLLDHIEPQGVGITRTTKGVLLRLPDGHTTMLHFSGSDHRERDNVRARLRRAGVTMPGDKRTDPLPASITDAKVYPSTVRKVAGLLEHWDQRYISAVQLERLAKREDTTVSHNAGQKALYQLGWTPVGPTRQRKWMRPLELEPDLFESVTDTPEPTELEPTPLPEDLPAAPAGVREFIDTHDSWTATPALVPAELTLGQVWALLDGLGLQGELRVWRRTDG